MKLAKRTLAVLLACLMVFGSFGVVGSAKFNLDTDGNHIDTLPEVDDGKSHGTVTYGLDIYKVGEDESLTQLSDGDTLAPGDVVEVQVAFGTNFFASLFSTIVYYDSNYFQPYLDGAVYTDCPKNTFEDGNYIKCLTDNGDAVLSGGNETYAPMELTLWQAVTSVEDKGFIGLVNQTDVKSRTPFAWRSVPYTIDGAPAPLNRLNANCDIDPKYEDLKFVFFQISFNNQSTVGQGRNIKIPYAPYFSFQLQVKEGADSAGEAVSGIFIPTDAAKRASNQTANMLYATNTDKNGGMYSNRASQVVSFGQGYDLTNCDYDFKFGAGSQHEHAYGQPTWSWNSTYTEATATFACECGDEQTVTTSKIDSQEVTPATCTANQVVQYSTYVDFEGTRYPTTTEAVSVEGTALGHSYGEPAWVWADDHTSATATFTCGREGCGHTEDVVTTDITTNTISEQSCTTDEVVTYTATATINNTEYTNTTEEITTAAQTGHAFGDWEDEGDPDVHIRYCDNGCGAFETEPHAFTIERGITKEATLTEPGLKLMECSVCHAQKDVPYELDHEHAYGEPAWSWNETFTEATATFTCACGDTQTVTTTDIDCNTIDEASCGVDKTVQYLASVEFNDETYDTSTDVISVPGTALSHDFGEPTWVWAEDHTSATATFTCGREGCGYSEDVVTDDITTNTISEQSCTTDEVVTYTATATFNSAEYTNTTDPITTATATGHTYGDPVSVWAEDYSSVTATFTCACGDTQTASSSNIDCITIEEESCGVDRTVKYVASVEFNDETYEVSTEVISVPGTALSHEFGEPAWAWNNDHTSATATFTCGREGCGYSEDVVTTDITTNTISEQSCTTDEVVTYTAKATFNGTEYTNTTEEITTAAQTGHTWGDWTYVDEDYHGRVCLTCSAPDENQAHDWVKDEEASTPATTTAGGEDVFCCSGCKATKTVPTEKLDHDHIYGEPTWVWADDFTSATATFGCTLCDDTVTKTDSAPVWKEVSAATCTEAQKIAYTATVSFNSQSYSDTTDPMDGEAATGHTYEVTAVDWAADYSSVTVTLTCTAGDDEQTVTTSVIGTETIEEAGICGKDAVVKYTATVEIDEQSFDVVSDPVTQEGTALSGHEYGDPEWAWSDDYTEATATFKCKNCDDEHVIAADIDTTVVQALSCTDDKIVIYTASADFNKTEYTADSERVTVETAAGHDWTGSYEALDDDYHAVTCAVCGATNDEAKQAHDFSIECGVIREATVTQPGLKTVECSVCGHQKDVEFTEEHLHEFGDPTWAWNDDYTQATATFACIDGDYEEAVSTTDIDCEELEEPECGKDQVVQYLASVEFNGETYENTTNPVSVAGTALEHSYGGADWAWNDDYTAATATFVCANCGDKQVLDASITENTVTALSCTTDEVVTYTAKVTFNGTDYFDTTEQITKTTATGHTYGEPVWNWAEDHTSATVTFTCTAGDDVKVVNALISTNTVSTQSCTTDYVVTYTAKANFNDKEYTNTTDPVKLADATGHSYGDPDWVWADDYSSVTATFTCGDCGDTKTVTVDSSAFQTTEVAPAGCETDQIVKYTATVTLDDKTYTGTSDNVTVADSALGHNYEQTDAKWAADNSTVDVTFTCGNCGETTTVTGTSEKTTSTDASGNEVITYTAKVTVDGKEYTVSTSTTVPGLKIYATDKDGNVKEGKNISVTVPYTRKGQVAVTLDANKDVTWEMTTTKNFRTMTLNGNKVTFNHLWILRKHKTVVVTATDKDGNKATCTVTIKLKWWQYLIHLILFGCLWY